MKKLTGLRVRLTALTILGWSLTTWAATFFPANHPCIQYYGRWDRTHSLHARYSWPGVYLCTAFTGTSIGIRLDDHTNYFNVYVDGKLHGVFHGTKQGDADYLLADSLDTTRHTLLFSRRNITFGEVYAFSGFFLDSNATLLPPPPRPSRKIEFIGDSFTAAESNEATEPELPWEARFPVTNIDKGFAALIARHFHAEYATTCRSGSGMLCDWQGNRRESIPARFDRTLMEANQPKWDFTQWVPDVVVICLGLNDRSGLRDTLDNVSAEHSDHFRRAYHGFFGILRLLYPGVPIVAVAAFPEWIRTNVQQIVDEEIALGTHNIYYASFDEFPGGYVANGHPTVATHQKMAAQIIAAMESFGIFPTTK